MMNYKNIIATDFYKSCCKKIEEYVKTTFVDHGLLHVSHVIANVKKLSKLFYIPQQQEDLILAAAVLHDIGYTISKHDHVQNSALLAKEFMKQCDDFSDEEIEQIYKIILNHGGKNRECYDDLPSVVMILADKMDFSCSRFASDLEKHPRATNFKKINAVRLVGDGLNYEMEIVTSKGFDKQEFKSTYFEHKLKPVISFLNECCDINIGIKYVSALKDLSR